MTEVSTTSPQAVAGTKRKSPFVEFWVRLVRKKPLGTFGGVITLLFLFTAIFSDFLAPYGMNEIGVAPTTLAPPSSDHLLGSDQLGRDEFSRIIYGSRVSVIVSLTATALSVVISILIGIFSGLLGGKFDIIVQRFVDAWMCFPGLIVLIIAVSILGPGMWQIIVVLGLLYGIGGSRIVRSAVIAIKKNIYVDAAQAIGCSTTRMLAHHILPNIMAPIIILFSTRIPTMIMVEASLSFLGFGIPPPAPTWGGMLSIDGMRFMLRSPLLAVWPGLCLAIVVYGVNMFGDALRDLLDPSLRGGVGRYTTAVRKVKKSEEERKEKQEEG